MNHTDPLVVADADTDLDSRREFEAGQLLRSCASIKYPARQAPRPSQCLFESYDPAITLAFVVVDAVNPDSWKPCAIVKGIVPEGDVTLQNRRLCSSLRSFRTSTPGARISPCQEC